MKSYVHATMSVLSPVDGIRCIRFKAALSRPIAEWNTLMYTPVVFKPVLQAPLPCTFCMSPLSDTPNSGLAVSTNELMS